MTMLRFESQMFASFDADTECISIEASMHFTIY